MIMMRELFPAASSAIVLSILLSLSLVVVEAQPNELLIGFPEQSIVTNKECYLREQPIYSHFINQESRRDDWLGIYAAGTSVEDLGLETLKMWVWTGGSQRLQSNEEFSSVKFSSPGEAYRNNWPLEEGEYFSVLARNTIEPYEAVTYSTVFTVQGNCGGLTLNPSSAPIGNDDDDDDDDDDDNDDNSSPTDSPTNSPADPPTNSPTDSPTNSPTDPSTNPPTDPLTNPPTNPYTLSPVIIFTPEPTDVPTPEPSEQKLTDLPTPMPTKQPVMQPTDSPTKQPIEQPTDVPTLPPTNAPIPSAPTQTCPEIPESGCSVCGEGKCVGNPDAVFTFPSQPEVACSVLQQAGINGNIPLGQCSFLPPLVFMCGCRNGEVAPVAPVAPPSEPPSPACPPVPSDGCSVCGEGKCVGAPKALFSFPNQPVVPCGTLQEAGLLGTIPLSQCSFLPVLIPMCDCREG